MRIRLIALGVVSVLTLSVFVFLKYDEWFVYPGLIQSKRGHAVQNLRDPATVQFKNEQLTSLGWLCGEMNGKNAYGAYTGFKRFVSRSYDDAYIEGSGYAGKPDARSAAQIIADLETGNEFLKNLSAVAKYHPDLSTPSQAEIDAMTERAIFKKRWADHCT